MDSPSQRAGILERKTVVAVLDVRREGTGEDRCVMEWKIVTRGGVGRRTEARCLKVVSVVKGRESAARTDRYWQWDSEGSDGVRWRALGESNLAIESNLSGRKESGLIDIHEAEHGLVAVRVGCRFKGSEH